MAKKILISVLIIILIALFFALKYSRVKFPDDFYYLKSPDRSKVITIMDRGYLFEAKSSKKDDSGLYLFYGEISKLDTIPKNHLKIKYSDSPFYIAWGDTIRIIYKYALEDRLDNSKINFSSEHKESDVHLIGNKVRMKDYFEMFFLDEIFRNKADKKRK